MMKSHWRFRNQATKFLQDLAQQSPIICIFVFSCLFIPSSAVRCQACFTSCPTENPQDCDCAADTISECQGPVCFAKLEVFLGEGHTSIVKGCSSEMPGSEPGCFNSGYTDSIACHCNKDKCNTRDDLNSYIPKPLPEVECCRCEFNPDLPSYCEQVGCDSALNNTCKGQYCYYDIHLKTQSCGYGYSPMRRNYYKSSGRTFSQIMQGSDCIHAIGRNEENFVFGCVCHGNKCNDALDMENLYSEDLLKEINQNEKDGKNHRCYTLGHRGPSAANASIYRKAGHCYAEYCFVTYATSRFAISDIVEEVWSNDGEEAGSDYYNEIIEQRIPIIEAGCVRATDEENLRLGCVTEWRTSEDEPLQKTCLCKGHMCNYYTQIHPEELSKYIANPTGRRLYQQKIKDGEEVPILSIQAQDSQGPLTTKGSRGFSSISSVIVSVCVVSSLMFQSSLLE